MTYAKCIIALAVGWTFMEIQPLHFYERTLIDKIQSIGDFWSFGLTTMLLHWMTNR